MFVRGRDADACTFIDDVVLSRHESVSCFTSLFDRCMDLAMLSVIFHHVEECV